MVAGAVVALVVAGIGAGALSNRAGASPVRLALVTALSGPNAASSQSMVQGAQLYMDEANRAGGIAGRPVELTVFDDRDDPQLARARAEEIVADGRYLGVIGHRSSGASLQAAPIHAAAGMPAVTPTSTADAVTSPANSTYFRMMFTNRAQGEFIGTYVRNVLAERSIVVVAGTDDFGRSLSGAVLGSLAEGEAKRVFTLDTSSQPPPGEAVDELPREAAAAAGRDLIVVALSEDAARLVVPALRRAGFAGRIFGGDSIGSEEFFQHVSGLTPEGAEVNFADGLYATAPVINDALTGDAVRWLSNFTATYGTAPTWRGATSYQAALVLVTALRSARPGLRPESAADDRRAVVDGLGALSTAEKSVHGIIGPIWFDTTRFNDAAHHGGHGAGRALRVRLRAASSSATPWPA